MRPGSAPPERAARLAIEPERLAKLAHEAGVELSLTSCERLLTYAQLLLRWNRVHNLTAISDPGGILTHHLLDSLAIIAPLEDRLGLARADQSAPHESMPRSQIAKLRFLDAGTGAGLPGIPLAIARPHWRGTLVDAVEKKTAFLLHARSQLHLDNVEVHHARLENLHGPRLTEAFDVIVSRAFSSLAEFVSLTRTLLRAGGTWVAMKGHIPEEEMRALAPDIAVADTITLHVPMLDETRHLILLRARHAPASSLEK
jgi:16S rRNA (guanine527-N7)-methyltransferase